MKINKLVKKYGNKIALNIDDWDLPAGKIVGIIGPNGAGKTTLLNILAGIDDDYEGTVSTGFSKKETTLVFQKAVLLSTSVRKNLLYPLKIRGWQKEKAEGRVEALSKDLKINHILDKNAKSLSGGEGQKVSLGRGLSFFPRLLLLDEPTASIDPALTAEIERILVETNKIQGTTIYMVTHNLAQAKRICHKVVLLNKGELVEEGNTLEFLENPQEEQSRKFIEGELIF